MQYNATESDRQLAFVPNAAGPVRFRELPHSAARGLGTCGQQGQLRRPRLMVKLDSNHLAAAAASLNWRQMDGLIVLRMSLTRRRCAAVAMVLALAMQMLALAMGTGHMASWLQARAPGDNIVCTAAGMMRVLPGGELERLPDAPATGVAAGVCSFCASAASQLGPASSLVHALVLPPPAGALLAGLVPVARLTLAPPHLRPPAHAPPRLSA